MILALLFSLNTQREFCEQHQLLMASGVLLVFLSYHSLLVAEKDFTDPFLQRFWGFATLLAIEPPPSQTIDRLTLAEDSSSGRTDVSAGEHGQERSTLRKR